MNSLLSKPRIGFIGLGIMGQSMAGHLLAAGHPMSIYNRSPEKTEALVARGAKAVDTPAQVANQSDIVITMVGYPRDVEEIWLGPGGLIAQAKNALLIDMTTSSPALAKRLAEIGLKAGNQVLDAPVSGGDVGAREAKLSIMVGGELTAFEKALPIFKLMGSKVVRMGDAGAGQHTKMSNQIIIASTIMGVSEGLAYAKRAGLDSQALLDCIGGGAAGGFQLNMMGARIAKGDFAPGFFIEHFLKDLGIALHEAEQMGLDLPGATLARKLYDQMANDGHGRLGTQALFQLYNSGA
jgi:3-hydroxyisobutyrate dehydrogenase